MIWQTSVLSTAWISVKTVLNRVRVILLVYMNVMFSLVNASFTALVRLVALKVAMGVTPLTVNA